MVILLKLLLLIYKRNMKKLFILLAIIGLLASCSEKENKTEYYCQEGTIRVLNKERYPCVRGGYCSYLLYLYNGKVASWYNTDARTWNKYNINDTLPTIVLQEVTTILKK